MTLEIEAGGAFISTRIEWALRPHLSVLSRLSGDADSLLALLWSVDFDTAEDLRATLRAPDGEDAP